MGCTTSLVQGNHPSGGSKLQALSSPSLKLQAGTASYSSLNSLEAADSSSEFHKQYVLGKKLGEGSYGEVRRAEHRFTDALVAVKVLDAADKTKTNAQSVVDRRSSTGYATPTTRNNKRRGSSMNSRTSMKHSKSAASTMQRSTVAKFHKAVQAEVAMLEEIGQHPNCIQFYEVFWEKGRCYIITELCRCTLLDLLDNRSMSPPTPSELQRALAEMALAIAHVHEVGVMHRDIKPANFLLGGKDGQTIKLADFGAATLIPEDGSVVRSFCGTAPYMSPEMIGDEGYDEKTDVWSLGATYYWMLYGDYPYVPTERTPGKMKAAIYFNKPPPTYKPVKDREDWEMPAGAEDLIRTCLIRDVERRPLAAAVVRHRFIQSAEAMVEGLARKNKRQCATPSTDLASVTSWPPSDASTALTGMPASPPKGETGCGYSKHRPKSLKPRPPALKAEPGSAACGFSKEKPVGSRHHQLCKVHASSAAISVAL